VSEDTVKRVIETFRKALRAKSQNMSAVRESILRAIFTFDGHFSVDDLLHLLRKNGVGEAHLASVYRAIPLLLESKIIQPALVSRREKQLYELAFEQAHHDHLVCAVCGKVVEFQSEVVELLQKEIAERYGFELDAHVMELTGRCQSCRTKASAI
jgi:Fur family transcriptional regulator, ferric uptake regulator